MNKRDLKTENKCYSFSYFLFLNMLMNDYVTQYNIKNHWVMPDHLTPSYSEMNTLEAIQSRK